ncbi:hypothetical protein NDU88_006048 [Pleurodeles waltl]|uniref:Uncharacterized protein n=1 Tax=Pleurodeles waltl TaxID=8319 RepID=A0AAV7SNG2_PLEWA|nr:hypothetical protein NDU88_006048 [Pleurodeles waltl]
MPNDDIVESFAAYYKCVYASGTQEMELGCAELLQDIELSQLSGEDGGLRRSINRRRDCAGLEKSSFRHGGGSKLVASEDI